MNRPDFSVYPAFIYSSDDEVWYIDGIGWVVLSATMRLANFFSQLRKMLACESRVTNATTRCVLTYILPILDVDVSGNYVDQAVRQSRDAVQDMKNVMCTAPSLKRCFSEPIPSRILYMEIRGPVMGLRRSAMLSWLQSSWTVGLDRLVLTFRFPYRLLPVPVPSCCGSCLSVQFLLQDITRCCKIFLSFSRFPIPPTLRPLGNPTPRPLFSHLP